MKEALADLKNKLISCQCIIKRVARKTEPEPSGWIKIAIELKEALEIISELDSHHSASQSHG